MPFHMLEQLYLNDFKMDFRPFIVMVKQPPNKSLTFEINTERKHITLHDNKERRDSKDQSRPGSTGKVPE